jgi:hypothetical protein
MKASATVFARPTAEAIQGPRTLGMDCFQPSQPKLLRRSRLATLAVMWWRSGHSTVGIIHGLRVVPSGYFRSSPIRPGRSAGSGGSFVAELREFATSVKKIRLTRDRKWQKMAKKPRIVSRKAGIVYLSKRINCCVFTIFDPCTAVLISVKSMAYVNISAPFFRHTGMV